MKKKSKKKPVRIFGMKQIVLDVNGDSIPKTLRDKMRGQHTYFDCVLKEHIYSEGVFEEMTIPFSLEERVYVKAIIKAMRDAEAGYLRFIF